MNNTITFTTRVTKYSVGLISIENGQPIIHRFHLDEGLYLSIKGRACTLRSAATFTTKQEAVEHFHAWVTSKKTRLEKYKLEVIEYSTQETVERELYDQSHPLWEVDKNEKAHIIKLARAYYFGYLHELMYSDQTIKRHQKVLRKYGIDLWANVPAEYDLQNKSNQIRSEYE